MLARVSSFTKSNDDPIIWCSLKNVDFLQRKSISLSLFKYWSWKRSCWFLQKRNSDIRRANWFWLTFALFCLINPTRTSRTSSWDFTDLKSFFAWLSWYVPSILKPSVLEDDLWSRQSRYLQRSSHFSFAKIIQQDYSGPQFRDRFILVFLFRCGARVFLLYSFVQIRPLFQETRLQKRVSLREG